MNNGDIEVIQVLLNLNFNVISKLKDDHLHKCSQDKNNIYIFFTAKHFTYNKVTIK